MYYLSLGCVLISFGLLFVLRLIWIVLIAGFSCFVLSQKVSRSNPLFCVVEIVSFSIGFDTLGGLSIFSVCIDFKSVNGWFKVLLACSYYLYLGWFGLDVTIERFIKLLTFLCCKFCFETLFKSGNFKRMNHRVLDT